MRTDFARQAGNESALVAKARPFGRRLQGKITAAGLAFAIMHAFHLLLADTLLIVVDMLAALPGIAAFRQQFLARAFTVEVQIADLGNKLVYALIAALILRSQSAQIRLHHLAVIHACHRQNNTGVDIRQGAFNRITALQHRNIRLQLIRQTRIALRRHLHGSQRVAEMVILPGAVDNQLRLKVLQNMRD